MSTRAEKFISRSDVRFFLALLGVVVAVVIWGIKLEDKVEAQDIKIEAVDTDVDLLLGNQQIIKESLVRIETTLGIEQPK